MYCLHYVVGQIQFILLIIQCYTIPLLYRSGYNIIQLIILSCFYYYKQFMFVLYVRIDIVFSYVLISNIMYVCSDVIFHDTRSSGKSSILTLFPESARSLLYVANAVLNFKCPTSNNLFLNALLVCYQNVRCWLQMSDVKLLEKRLAPLDVYIFYIEINHIYIQYIVLCMQNGASRFMLSCYKQNTLVLKIVYVSPFWIYTTSLLNGEELTSNIYL